MKYYFLIGLVLFLSTTLVARAAPALTGFVLQPAKVEIILKPGELIKRELTVMNENDRPVRVQITLEDFGPDLTPAAPVNLAEPAAGNPFSLQPYLTLPVRTLDLAPGQSARVPVFISLPVLPSGESAAAVSGLYGAVIFSFAPVESEPAENYWTTTHSRLGALFFVRTTGLAVRETGALAGFGLLGGRLIKANHPPTFYLNYTNQGNIHLNPYGVIFLTNRLTGQQSEIIVDPWFVLPQSSRIREIAAAAVPSAGWYRAELKLNRGYADLIDAQSFSFFVWSWPAVVGAGFSFLLILFIILKGGRYFWRKLKK